MPDMNDDDISRLEAAALKAREFTHQVGERCYTLRVPTRTDVRECVIEHRLDRAGPLIMPPLLRRYLLEDALVGWTGVRARDVLPTAGSDPLPWSQRAVVLLIDGRPDEADDLGRVLMAEADKRHAAAEADAKNSPPVSPPSEAPRA